MSKMVSAKKKPTAANILGGIRQIAAGEFKAKCLALMDEVNKTGRPLVVTKRGEPVIEIFPARKGRRKRKDDFFGRMVGIAEIVGDPDDLIKPIFPLEDWDMLK